MFGKITLKDGVSVWPNAVMRAEQYEIVVGENSNVQDFVMIHVGDGVGTFVGKNCSITHRATLHGCTLGDNCLIGINATIMDRVEIGENSIVAGHCIVPEDTVIPANSIVAGVPGRVVKTRNNWLGNRMNAWLYRYNADGYAEGDHRAWSRNRFAADYAAEEKRLRARLEQSSAAQ